MWLRNKNRSRENSKESDADWKRRPREGWMERIEECRENSKRNGNLDTGTKEMKKVDRGNGEYITHL